MKTPLDLSRQKFGRLTAVSIEEKIEGKPRYWLCKCDCGNEVKVQTSHLRNGHTQSCGCLQRDRCSEAHIKHGMYYTKAYTIWRGIKGRCLQPNHMHYKYYGGRGIKICDEWRFTFLTFYEWAISSGYQEHLTIERVDNDGNYEPSNCIWIPRFKQGENKRNNIPITYKGETKTVIAWSRALNINEGTLRSRLNQGWSETEAFETPVNSCRKKR